RSCTSELQEVGDALAVRATRAEQRLERLRALDEELHVALPREAHAAVDLDAVAADDALAIARRRLRHRRPERPPPILLADRPRGEVPRSARLLDLHEHVGALVLDRLERADRLIELAPVLRVLDRDLEQALARSDTLECRRHRGALERAAQRPG